MKKQTKIILIILASLMGLISIGIIIYPVVSNVVYESSNSQVMTDYSESVDNTASDEIEQLRADAEAYNNRLQLGVITDENLEIASREYYDQLNVSSSGMMGYVEIPKLDVYLPIYHGTEAETLEYGAGHLIGSSLPIGGTSTHTVIAAHSGLAGQKMFSDLDQLEEGDIFYLHVLDEVLAYQVDEINVVLPDDISLIQIEEGEDLCTLVTCTPYTVNTHRLLVRGTRIPYEEAQEVELKESDTTEIISNWQAQYMKGLTIGAVLMASGLLGMTVVLARKRGRRE